MHGSCNSTLQADALKLVAQRLQSSLAVEGDLPEDGLAAYGDTGDDLMMALARKLVS
ncbi:MAG: DEAD/DEAH box helicase [Chloroflexi bacterium]|nr:DEAD/DEAH box helicase [Chloroflexota bacterium]MDE2710127.1 DEAD/DEAH box helicase [Chloroflexota bacterium]